MTTLKFGDKAALFAACSLVTIALTGCGRDGPAASAERSLPEVRVVELKHETIATERTWLGLLESLRSADMRAPEAGEISAVEVAEGDQVERGSILVSVEGTELRARQTVLERRREMLEESLERWRELSEAGAAGPSEVEGAEREYLEVAEQLAALQARMRSVQLRASVTGQVTSILVAPGAWVSAGDPILQIRDRSAQGIRLQVAGRESGYFDDLELLRMEDAGGGLHVIERIVAIEDPQAPRGYLSFEIWLENPPESGSREMKLTYRSERSAVLAPWTAIAREGDAHWVALVGGDPAVVTRRQVRLGEGHAGGVEIVEGLTEGDRILRFEPRSQPEGVEVLARGDGGAA
jgi:RND family efflux transporter MFP subunit